MVSFISANFKKDGKGFTLIELLCVSSIISLLSSITLSNIWLVRARARDTVRLAHIDGLLDAFQIYYSDYGYWPTISLAAPENYYPDGRQICDASTGGRQL